jgi:hypothetical protein
MTDSNPPITTPLTEEDLERIRRETERPPEHDTDPAPADHEADTIPPPPPEVA